MMKGLMIRAVAIFLWMASPILVSTATFAVFTLTGNTLTAEVEFSFSISIIIHSNIHNMNDRSPSLLWPFSTYYVSP